MRWVSLSRSSPMSPDGVGAAGVEIAQRERAKPVGAAIVGEHALDHPFRGAVGIDRRAGVAFGQGLAVGVAVDRAGRGKHQAIAARLAHRFQQRQRAGEVVDVVFLRIGDGLADQARCREVHHRDDVVLREGARQRGLVGEVAGHQRAGDELAVAGGEIVENHGVIAGRRQRPAAMRADVARAAGHQNGRTIIHLSSPASGSC